MAPARRCQPITTAPTRSNMTQHLIGQPQGVGMLGSMASPSIEQVEKSMKKQTPPAAG